MIMTLVKELSREASLDALLSDPICIAVMRSHGLEPDAVLQEMKAVARHLRRTGLVMERAQAA